MPKARAACLYIRNVRILQQQVHTSGGDGTGRLQGSFCQLRVHLILLRDLLDNVGLGIKHAELGVVVADERGPVAYRDVCEPWDLVEQAVHGLLRIEVEGRRRLIKDSKPGPG